MPRQRTRRTIISQLAALAMTASSAQVTLAPPAAATVQAAVPGMVFVNGSGGIATDAVNGDSCSNPNYGSIEDAVNTLGTDVATTVIHVCGYDGSYSVANLSLEGDITLEGDGVGKTVVDPAGDGAFIIATGSITLRGMTVQNGYTGGIPNGGAINAGDDVVVTDAEFRGNFADFYGGAIYAGGKALIERSSFIGNAAGMGNTGFGGAVFAEGDISVVNTTFSGNAADNGSAAYSAGGNVEAYFSTIADGYSSQNVAGPLFAATGHTVHMYADLLVDNLVGDSPMNCAVGATFVDGAGNISTDETCTGAWDTNVNGVSTRASLNLGDVTADPSDVAVSTMPLGVGSAALGSWNCNSFGSATINANANLLVDGRGFTRRGGFARCDVGAYAFVDHYTAYVNASPRYGFVPVRTDANGRCTEANYSNVTAAVDDLNTGMLPPGTIIHVCSGTYMFEEMHANKSLILEGNGASSTTIDCDGDCRVLEVSDGDATISDITLNGGHAPAGSSRGGNVDVENGNVTLVRSVINNGWVNECGESGPCVGQGGGLYASGWVHVRSSKFFWNGAGTTGGAIYAGGDVSLVNATLSENSSNTEGSAVYSASGDMEIFMSTIASNISYSYPFNQASFGQLAPLAVADTGAQTIALGGNLLFDNGTNAATSAWQGNCTGVETDKGGNVFVTSSVVDAHCSDINDGHSAIVNSADFALANPPDPDLDQTTSAEALDVYACDGSQFTATIDDQADFTVDSRGVTRPQYDSCDAGAYELDTRNPTSTVLYVVPIDAPVTYGAAVPVYGYTLHSGSADGDVVDPSTLTTAPTCTSDYAAFSPTTGYVSKSPRTISCSDGSDSNYEFDYSATASLTIAKAHPLCSVTGYDLTYDGAAHTASGACTGVGVDGTLAGLVLTSTTHTNVGTYTGDSWSFSHASGNYETASGFVNDRIGKTSTAAAYTGARWVVKGDSFAVSVSGVPASCTSGVQYSLDVNPITGSPGPYLLTVWSGTASTATWQPGAYLITVAVADGNCSASSDVVGLTVGITSAGSAFGGGYINYTPSRANFGFEVQTFAKTATQPSYVKGQVVWILKGNWKFKGTLTSYSVSSGTGTAKGTGTLYFWSKSSSGGSWVQATSGATTVTLTFTASVAATKSKSLVAGKLGIAFGGTKSAASPTLPTYVSSDISYGTIRMT